MTAAPHPRHLFLLPTVAALLAVLMTACGPGNDSNQGSDVDVKAVYTVNYPLAYFAERIAGDRLKVTFPGPQDEDPAFWTPDDEVLGGYQQAGLILLNGATYAKWTAHTSLPESRLVNTSEGFAHQFIETESESHSHGKEGKHDHGGIAFTTWIDFTQAKQQATAIRDAFVRRSPSDEATFREGYEALAADLDDLDSAMKAVAGRIGDTPLLASHPVYQYWARRYGLMVEALVWEPETVPDEEAMKAMEAIRVNHPAAWMIWEGDPDPKSVKKLEDAGVQSLVFSPSGAKPESGDWLSVMKANIAALEAAFPEA